MTYRLKDEQLQRKLDELSNGDFSKKLENEAQRKFVGVLNREVIYLYYGDFDALANRFSALFELDEVEEIPEYNPCKWNEWPAVEPPKGAPMRLEARYRGTSDGRYYVTVRQCAWFDGIGNWISSDGDNIEDRLLKNKEVRFRPWVDPDEEENEKCVEN